MTIPRNVHLSPPPGAYQTPERVRLRDRVVRLWRKHGKKLWWIHSAYALVIGISVVTFAQKGFEHVRWLAVTLGATWVLVLVFFRAFDRPIERPGSRPGAAAPVKLRFYVMTYVLKNLYQGMLFFLLPFYWKSATVGAPNLWFLVMLAVVALLSTIDIVFDRFLMRVRLLGSVFHAITLFGCMNLVVPALLPNTRTLWSLLTAAAVTVIAFWTIHVRLALLKDRRFLALLVLSIPAAVAVAYELRVAIPPVPMHLSSAAIGPSLLPDGRLSMEVTSVNASKLSEVIAVTDVVVPGGKGDQLLHVWRREGLSVFRAPEAMTRVRGPSGTVRLRSTLDEAHMPKNPVGAWTVDVETDDGQLVGRAHFRVLE
jgi:uncharacterized protein DUF5924/DUF2914 family protein